MSQQMIHTARESLITILLLVLSCVLIHTGCSEQEQPPPAHGSIPPYAGPMSMDEMIAYADVIVHVEPAESISARTITVNDMIYEANDKRRFVPALQAGFRVIEYLKGSGDSRITVIIPYGFDNWLYGTEKGALERAEEWERERSARWDDRQALLFLREAATATEIDGWNVYPAGTHRFVGMLGGGYYDRYYTIENKYTRVWLPSATAPSASGQAGVSSGSSDDNDIRFFTEAPAEEVSATPVAAVDSAASGTTSPQTPSVSKIELRTRIAEIDAILKEGEGIEGYDECVHRMFMMERVYASEYGRLITNPVVEWNLDSGLAADTIISSGRGWGAPGVMDIKYRLTGPDADLFSVGMFNMDALKSQGDEQTRTTRPIPEGTYRFNLHIQNPWEQPCDYAPEEGVVYETVHVTAPSGTLHEAFFDPIAEGTALVADDFRGVLKPTEFSSSGATTTIQRIGWDSNRAWMELSTSTVSLTGHHIDFIELDGSVGLTLDFDDAAATTTDDGAHILLWGVCDQPWVAGDKLMVRMSLSDTDLTGTTDDTSCDGVAIDTTTPPAVKPLPCTNGVAVPNPRDNLDLVSDCGILLAALDVLLGTQEDSLAWSEDKDMNGWSAVTVSGTPARVTELTAAYRGLSGTIPAELGSLDALTSIDLRSNQLTGSIPSELGNLANLEFIHLKGNSLSGAIPSELGNLSSLKTLFLSGNGLSGSIPVELGSLANLEKLTLHDNDLTGDIPSELGNLTKLSYVYISGNELTGCVPASWEGIDKSDDPSVLGLSYCESP